MLIELEKLEKQVIWPRKKYQKNYYQGKPTKKMQKYLDLKEKVSWHTRKDVNQALQDFFGKQVIDIE